jgi:protein subunit release factor A
VGLRLENIGRLLDELDELRTELAMLGELLELADDEPLMAECHADLRALAVRIGAMHGRVPSDNAEREAILTIEAKSGEAENWTYVLWRMYVEQAERDGWRVRIHNRYMGEFGLRSVTMWIGGAGAGRSPPEPQACPPGAGCPGRCAPLSVVLRSHLRSRR